MLNFSNKGRLMGKIELVGAMGKRVIFRDKWPDFFSAICLALRGADDEGAARRVDHLVSDESQIIDLQDALDLHE